MLSNPILIVLLVVGVGALAGGAGYSVAVRRARKRTQQAQGEADQIVAQARRDAESLLKEARVEAKEAAIRARETFEKETAKTREDLRERERLAVKREDGIDSKMETLNSKEKTILAMERRVSDPEKGLQTRQAELERLIADEKQQLYRISGLSQGEARALLLGKLEAEVQHEAAVLIQRVTDQAQETAADKAREILTTTIQRLASDFTAEVTVSTVDIPSDDMKGRIIGREGRNIRAFERATGIDVIVDDTPGVIVLSSFDPVRREVARRAMAKLITDGRIQPPRIEQVVSETTKEVEKDILETGKQVALDTGVRGLHPKEVELLGRLKYRTSYGQSVLVHSIEVAHLSAMLAEELGLDGELAKRAGLLHDIGKAIDHEVEGGHPEIGADIARRCNEPPVIVHAIA